MLCLYYYLRTKCEYTRCSRYKVEHVWDALWNTRRSRFTQVNTAVCKIQLIERVSSSASAHVCTHYAVYRQSAITECHNRRITRKYKINYRRVVTRTGSNVPFLLTARFHCNYFPMDPYPGSTGAPDRINIPLAISISKRSAPVFARGIYLPRFWPVVIELLISRSILCTARHNNAR